MNNLFSADNIIVYTFLIITLIVGLYSGMGIKTVREYTIADKKLSTTVITITLLATMIGGGSIFGNLDELHNTGVIYIGTILGSILGAILFGLIIAPRIDERFDGCLSLGDVINRLYGEQVNKVASLFICGFAIMIISAQMIGLANFISNFLKIDYTIASLLINGIVVIYASHGGIKSVAFTDVMQLIVFIAIFPVIATTLLQDAGGFEMVYKASIDIGFWDFEYDKKFMDYTSLFIFFLFAPVLVGNALMQRFLMLKNKNHIPKVNFMYAFFEFVVTILVTMIFLSAITLYPNIQAGKEVLPIVITNSFNKIFGGLLIVAIIAMLMSTIDSFLNSTGIMFTHNLINFFPSKKLLEIKITTFIIGVIAILISLNNLPIMKMIVLSEGLIIGGVSIPVMAGLLGFKVDKISYYTCAIPTFFIFLISIKVLEGFHFLPSLIAALTAISLFAIIYILRNKYSFSSFITVKFFKKPNNLPNNFFRIWKRQSISVYNISNNKISLIIFAAFCTVSHFIHFSIFPSTQLLVNSHLFILRIIVGFICIALILVELWKSSFEKYINTFWNLALLYCLSFMPTIFFLTEKNIAWLVNVSLSLALLIILTNWFTFMILSSIGTILGIIFHCYFMREIQWFCDFENTYLIFYIVVFYIALDILFNRLKENGLMEKFELLQAFGGTMAHEVKTPLSSNQSSLSLMESIMDEEMKITKKAKTLNLEISEDNYKVMRYAMELMKKSNKSGKETVDMLLMSMKEGGELQGRKDQLSLKVCIDEALEEYGFERNQREQVRIKVENDISFIGDKEHIKHIIFNLIKNTFKHGGSDVNIEMIIEGDRLRFKDNGMGIAADKLPKIFDRFYTGSNTGTGLGLSFSKDIMKSIGGTIECESKEGEYTEFILKFSL